MCGYCQFRYQMPEQTRTIDIIVVSIEQDRIAKQITTVQDPGHHVLI